MGNWAEWRDYLRLAYYEDVALAFGVCLAIAVAINLATREKPRVYVQVGVLLFGVAILGATAGFAGGMSRDGAVGAIIPGALTLVGGAALYLFGADRSKGTAVSLTAGCFALALFLAYSSSSQLRNVGDEFRDLREKCAAAYTNDKLLGSEATFSRFEAAMKADCANSLSWKLN